MSHDVFISYVSQDKAVADAVVQVLEGAGVPCWIAPRDVEVGNYSGSLTRAIKASRVLVLVFSEGTNASKYVLRELDLALKGNAIIVPFRIDRTPPAEDLEFYLATPHWIDASDGRIEEHLPQLVARLERVLGMGGALPPVPVDAGQDPPSDSTVGDGAAPNTTRTAMRPRLSNRAPVALAMLAVVLIGVMYGWRAVRQPTPPAAVPVAPAPKSAGPVQGLAALEGHEDSVVSLAWDLTGPRLVSASRDHSLRLWDPTAPEAEAVLSGHTGPVWDTIWSSDGQLIASASEDHSIRLWDAATGKAGPVLRGHTQPVQLIAFGPGGLLASASLDHTIRIWDSATGALQQTLIGHNEAVWDLAWSPDGTRLLSGSSEVNPRLWDPATGEAVLALKGHTAWARTVTFSPDGKLIGTGGRDNTVRVWDGRTGAPKITLRGHTDEVTNLEWSPDGRWLASGSNDGSIGLWDGRTGAVHTRLTGHRGWIRAMEWSPDSRFVASGSREEGTVRLWDAAAGVRGPVLTGHTGAVLALAWSAGGETLASGGSDKLVRLWDISALVE